MSSFQLRDAISTSLIGSLSQMEFDLLTAKCSREDWFHCSVAQLSKLSKKFDLMNKLYQRGMKSKGLIGNQLENCLHSAMRSSEHGSCSAVIDFLNNTAETFDSTTENLRLKIY